MAVGLFAILVGVFVGSAYLAGRGRERVSLDAEYYFLVKPCETSTAAAVAGEVYSAGGAGYLGGEGVYLACYYRKADARRVCSLMQRKGEAVEVDERSADDVVLSGGDVRYAEQIRGNAETVGSCARLFYDAANGLERGELSQSAARGAVRGAADALVGLKQGNTDGFFSKWNGILERIALQSREIAAGILFAKDLRYLQISLCFAVLGMNQCF